MLYFHRELNIGLHRGRTRVRADALCVWSRLCIFMRDFLRSLFKYHLRVRFLISWNCHNLLLCFALDFLSFHFSFLLFIRCASISFIFLRTGIVDYF